MAVRSKKTLSAHSVGLKYGWRSGLEELNAERLREARVSFEYEKITIRFVPPSKERRYKPDFHLLRNGILVETKGRFLTADRQKHLAVKAQHPDLDIRLVFSNPNARISKQSKTTYAMWCESKGFQYAARVIPEAWWNEPPNAAALVAIKRIREDQ